VLRNNSHALLLRNPIGAYAACVRRDALTVAGKESRPRMAENVMKSLLYSLAEARALVGVGRTTLYSAIRASELRAIKIGGRTFIPADELHRWIDGMPAVVPNQTQFRKRS
jgi:excisionase family DNA binding protein